MNYASEIACAAANLNPVGTPHTGDDTCCALCARPIRRGDLCTDFDLPRTFTDFEKLASSNHICGYCKRVTKQEIMRAFQRVVITPKGVYSLNKDEDRSWLWTDPPEGPFVVVINSNTTAAFHYIWQTPVTLDNRLISVNFDGVIARVQTGSVKKALALASMLHERALLDGHKKVSPSPFMYLSRDIHSSSNRSHGALTLVVKELAQRHPDCAAAAQFLSSLGTSELVALSPLLKSKPSEPVKPELLYGEAIFALAKARALEKATEKQRVKDLALDASD